MTEVKKFGRVEPVMFAIGDQQFEASPEVSASTMLDIANLREKLAENDSNEHKINVMSGMLKDLLSEDSHRRLVEGLKSRKRPGDADGAPPIGLHTMMEVVEWLFGEVYGGRPTQQPQ